MRKDETKIYLHKNTINKCPMCKTKLTKHNIECPHCGIDLKAFEDELTKNHTPKAEETQTKKRQTKESHLLPIIAIIVILLFAISIGFINDAKNSEATAQHHIINYF